MAIQFQHRRGTEAENNAFTGALAELTVDITNKSLRLHDGVTPGGVALVNSATNQTIAGVKTFTSSPIAPTPTAGDNSTKIATTEFVALQWANQSLASNGYQKLPGGLIMQWGRAFTNIAPGSTLDITFPIAFPSDVFYSDVVVVTASTNNQLSIPFVHVNSTSNLTIANYDVDSPITQIRWFSIGY